MHVGQAHDCITDLIPGALAVFCPACLQLGINIPPEKDWKFDEVCRNFLIHVKKSIISR
jgi:hypothetical protein